MRGFCYRGFGVLIENERGYWAACVFCQPLVAAGDYRSLAARWHSVLRRRKIDPFVQDLFRLLASAYESNDDIYWEEPWPWRPALADLPPISV